MGPNMKEISTVISDTASATKLYEMDKNMKETGCEGAKQENASFTSIKMALCTKEKW